MSITVTPTSAVIRCNKCKAAFSRLRKQHEPSAYASDQAQVEAEREGWIVSDHGDVCPTCSKEIIL